MRLGKMIFVVVMVALLSACGGSGGTDEPVNKTPIVNAGADKSVQVNETLTITGSGTDSDGTIVSYEWKKGSTVLATTATFDYLPTVVGTDTLTLTVTDDDGATASDSVVVTVTSIIPSSNSFNFAVLSYDEDKYAANYSDITSKEVSALHEWAEASKEFQFNGNMLIDLGLLSEDNSLSLVDAHKTKHRMWGSVPIPLIIKLQEL